MKHNIINSIFAISLLLCAAVGFQSCSNDNEPGDKPGLEDKESDLTLYYGVPYKLPFSTAGMTVIIEGGGIIFKDDVLYPNVMGPCVLKLYKGGRENLIKTINIKVVPNYDIDKLIKSINELTNDTTIEYNEDIKLIDIPELAKGDTIADYLSKRGIDLEVSQSLEYDPTTGVLKANKLGEYGITITINEGGYYSFTKRIHMNVVPNYELTMTSGDTKPLSEVIGDSRIGVPTSTDTDVARVKDWVIHAFASSTRPSISSYQQKPTYIYAGNKVIKLTVEPYNYPDPFPLDSPFNYRLNIDEMRTAMSDFNFISEKIETLNDNKYIVLTYAPYYNSKSVSIYFKIYDKHNTGIRMAFTRIDTGQPSKEIFNWLVSQSQKPVFKNSTDLDIKYFEWEWYDIYPVDGEWSIVSCGNSASH